MIELWLVTLAFMAVWDGSIGLMAAVNGTCKKWIHHRGYGFLTTESGEEIFCHVTQLRTGTQSLAVGQRVMFDIVDSDRKPGSKMAKNVRVIE